MAKIIISVPHSFCRGLDDIIRHYCDVVAARAARGLTRRLTDAGHEILLHMADVNREALDLNRPESRPSKFRKALAKDFSKADFLLDCHSFQGALLHWETDIVLLKWDDGQVNNRSLVWRFSDCLTRKDLNVATTNAEAHDDIVQDALQNGLPAILAEFSEASVAADAESILDRFSEALDELIRELPEREEAKESLENLCESLVDTAGRISESSRNVVRVNPDYVGVSVPNPRVRLPEKGLESRGDYHITLLSPDEIGELLTRKGWTPDQLKAALEGEAVEGSPEQACIGKQEKGDNAVYYVVVRWPEAQEFRKRLGFEKTDLHITLGFRKSDIHGVPKNSSTCISKVKESSTGIGESTEKRKLDIQLSPTTLQALKDIQKAGGKGIVVGGAVRDAILGKQAKDTDIEVYGIPGEDLQKILEKYGKVNFVGKQFGIYKAWLDGKEMDFSLPRKEKKTGTGHQGFDVEVDPSMSYADASSRRDFTINTLGYDPIDETLYDPHGGLSDLKDRRIRMANKDAFRDDPLRVLRMAQFASRFDFGVDPETTSTAKEAPELETLPPERIYEEFRKALLRSPKPGVFIRALKEADAIRRLFPELMGREDEVSKILDATAEFRSDDPEDALSFQFSAISSVIGLSAGIKFLKRITSEVNIHEKMKNAVESLDRLNLAKVPTDSELRRWLSEIKEGNAGVVKSLISLTGGSAGKQVAKRMDDLAASVTPIILGRHLVSLGVSPGKQMGGMLRDIYSRQLDGEFNNLSGGLELAKKIVGASAVSEEFLQAAGGVNMRPITKVSGTLGGLLEKLDQAVHGLRPLREEEQPDAGLDQPEGQRVVVVDVDSTVMDVSARGVAALADQGIKATPDQWSEVVDSLHGKTKSLFFKNFQSDKYTDMDTVNEGVVKELVRISKYYDVPVVVLTGRPSSMGSTESVASMLKGRGLNVLDVLRRPSTDASMRTSEFKVKQLKDKGYIPVAAIDDQDRILAAFRREWPEARLYKAKRDSAEMIEWVQK